MIMEKQPKFDYSDIKFKDNGKLKLIIVVGTRPEIIRLAAVITKCRQYFDVILAHTGQNYDYNLNGIFFKDLKLAEPEVYMDAVGDDLGATCGNIINCSYKLFAQTKPDGVLVLGDTNSCLSVIGAKRLHIPIFHMEAGNRCKDECLPEETNRRIVDIISDVNMAYSEHARRYLADCGLPKERTYVTGSPMAEVLHENLADIESSDVHKRLGLEKGKYILLSAHREENIDTEKNFFSLFNAINAMAEKYDMPILYSCHPRSRNRLQASEFQLDPRVQVQQPLGFHDYNCLQMNAYAVVSDSGTLLPALDILSLRYVFEPLLSVLSRWIRLDSSSVELMRKDFFSLLIPPSNLSEMVITGFQYLTTPTRMYPLRWLKLFNLTSVL